MSFDTAKPLLSSHIILRRDGKIAFILRQNTSWMDNYYGLLGGKVEKDENFTAATVREALEEGGVTVQPADAKVVHVMYRKDEINWVDVYFEIEKWEGEPTNTEPDKHGELAWLDPTDLPENVIPSVRFALEQIQAGKIFSEYGW